MTFLPTSTLKKRNSMHVKLFLENCSYGFYYDAAPTETKQALKACVDNNNNNNNNNINITCLETHLEGGLDAFTVEN
jgi:hypothetical protein